MFELVRLGLRHPRSKAVERVSVTVDFFGIRADPRESFVLQQAQFCRVRPDGCTFSVEGTGLRRRNFAGNGAAETRKMLGCGRRSKLNDINFALRARFLVARQPDARSVTALTEPGFMVR